MGIIEHRTPLPRALDLIGLSLVGAGLVFNLNRILHKCNQ